MKPKVFLTGGDGFGWALDEDLRTIRVALADQVDHVPLRDADTVISPWWEGLVQHGTDALAGKRIVCGLDNPPSYWLSRPRFREMPRLVGLWLAHSGEALAQARSFKMPAEFMPYALAPGTFKPLDDGARAELRKAHGIPVDHYVIGNFQRDTEGADLSRPKMQKGPDIFAAIVTALHRDGHPVHAVLAGPRRHWLRNRLRDDGVPVTCIGRETADDDLRVNMLDRSVLGRLYGVLDLYLLTSRWEGGPYGLLEAVSTRTKIQSTAVGVANDLLSAASVFSDVGHAIASIAADIRSGHLGAALNDQQERLVTDHGAAAVRQAGQRLVSRIAGIVPYRPTPSAAPVTIPSHADNTLMRRAVRLIRRFSPGGDRRHAGLTVSIFREYVKPPYGGGNQFMLALRDSLAAKGVRVLNNQVGEAIDGYFFDSLWFNPKLLDRLARLNRPRVVHRIDGPIHLYRGKDKELDDRIFDVNRQFATASVIQSRFTLQKILETGYEPVAPVIIHNASDRKIFNRTGRTPFDRNRKLRIISSSWSNNPRKGGDVYHWLDENLDFGLYDYRFMGRTSVPLRNIRQMEPVPSAELAGELRQCDIYITASQNDPCSNALIEALSCGLPAIFLRSGGHPELVGLGGLGFDRAEEIPALLAEVSKNYAAFQASISVESIDDVATRYLACIGV